LRDEADPKPYFNDDEDLLKAIAFYAYPRKTARRSGDPILERIRYFLYSYFALKPKILAITDNDLQFNTVSKTKAFINSVFVEKTNLSDKMSTRQMVENLKINIKEVRLASYFNGLTGPFISRTADVIESSVREIATSGIPKVLQRELDIVINKIDFNTKKSKK
jgi:hypothetical protein